MALFQGIVGMSPCRFAEEQVVRARSMTAGMPIEAVSLLVKPFTVTSPPGNVLEIGKLQKFGIAIGIYSLKGGNPGNILDFVKKILIVLYAGSVDDSWRFLPCPLRVKG